jgi:hypothetical protein
VTTDIVKKYEGSPEYRDVIENVSIVLAGNTTPLDKKRLAAEVLGELSDVKAIEPLASMLGSVDGILAERCQKALVRVTFNDFGFSERKWLNWYHKNKDSHRLEWAIESIGHKDESLRRKAVMALVDAVGNDVSLPAPPYDFKKRQQLAAVCTDWWKETGRNRFLKKLR